MEWLWEVWDIKAERRDREAGARSRQDVLINGHMKQLDIGLKEGGMMPRFLSWDNCFWTLRP